jgi:hypothetical protein
MYMLVYTYIYIYTFTYLLSSMHSVLRSLPFCLTNHKAGRGKRARSDDDNSQEEDASSEGDTSPENNDGEDSHEEDNYTPDSPKVYIFIA